MIVLDCSAAVEYGRAKDPASAISRAIDGADLVIAPALLKFELASAWWKYVRAGLCDRQTAAREVTDAISLVDAYDPGDGYAVEALAEAARLAHSPYDLFYLLLARRNAATLLTCDRALGRLCRSEGVDSLGWE